jgi:hypothetical protein
MMVGTELFFYEIVASSARRSRLDERRSRALECVNGGIYRVRLIKKSENQRKSW